MALIRKAAYNIKRMVTAFEGFSSWTGDNEPFRGKGKLEGGFA